MAVGSIGIRARTIVSAAFGDLRGAQAFTAAMSLKEGQFLIRHQEPRAALFNVDINGAPASADYLLLDALRAIDEGKTPTYALDPLPKAWKLDAVLEDDLQLAARIHEAARLSEMEAEMAAAHARSAQEELDALAEAKRAADARIAVLEAELADARAHLAALSAAAANAPPNRRKTKKRKEKR